MKGTESKDQISLISRLPSLDLDKIDSGAPRHGKGIISKTTRQYENATPRSFLKSNRSFVKIGSYSHRLVEEAEDMQKQEFVEKIKKNPFFRSQVNILLKEFSSKHIPINNYKSNKKVEYDFSIVNNEGPSTLKNVRSQHAKQALSLQQRWISWLNQSETDYKR